MLLSRFLPPAHALSCLSPARGGACGRYRTNATTPDIADAASIAYVLQYSLRLLSPLCVPAGRGTELQYRQFKFVCICALNIDFVSVLHKAGVIIFVVFPRGGNAHFIIHIYCSRSAVLISRLKNTVG
jgi:hypothetical protein